MVVIEKFSKLLTPKSQFNNQEERAPSLDWMFRYLIILLATNFNLASDSETSLLCDPLYSVFTCPQDDPGWT